MDLPKPIALVDGIGKRMRGQDRDGELLFIAFDDGTFCVLEARQVDQGFDDDLVIRDRLDLPRGQPDYWRGLMRLKVLTEQQWDDLRRAWNEETERQTRARELRELNRLKAKYEQEAKS